MPGRAIHWAHGPPPPHSPIPPRCQAQFSPSDTRSLTARATPPSHHWVLKVNYITRHLATDLTEHSRYRSCLPGESWLAPAPVLIPELVTFLTWSPGSLARMSTWSTASSWGHPSWSPAPASTLASWSPAWCPRTTRDPASIISHLQFLIWCSKVISTSASAACSRRGSH